jgi:hypothetical protein
MDLVPILRELWRMRRLVALAGLVAIFAGLAITYQLPSLQSRQYDVGVATARALLDTPSSAVADLGGEEGSTAVGALPSRAALLANLLTTAPLEDEIAKRAGISPDKLIANAPALANAEREEPADDRTSFILAVQNEIDLPLLTVTTQAPDPELARKLANSAVEVLDDHVSSVAGADSVPATRRLVVKPLGPARAGISTRGPRRLYGIVVSILVFGLGCATILIVSNVARNWRLAAELDEFSSDDFADEFPSSVVFHPTAEAEAEAEPVATGERSPQEADHGSAA